MSAKWSRNLLQYENIDDETFKKKVYQLLNITTDADKNYNSYVLSMLERCMIIVKKYEDFSLELNTELKEKGLWR